MSVHWKIRKTGNTLVEEGLGGNNWYVSLNEPHKMGLGSVEFSDIGKDRIKVRRFSSGGNLKWESVLARDSEYQIGPAKVVRVVSPEEEDDPLRKFLRIVGESPSVIKQHWYGEKVVHRGTRQPTWKGASYGIIDSTQKEWTIVDTEMSTYNDWYVTWEVQQDSGWAVVTVQRQSSNGNVYNHIAEIHFWGLMTSEALLAIKNTVAMWLTKGRDNAASFERSYEAKKKCPPLTKSKPRWNHCERW